MDRECACCVARRSADTNPTRANHQASERSTMTPASNSELAAEEYIKAFGALDDHLIDHGYALLVWLDAERHEYVTHVLKPGLFGVCTVEQLITRVADDLDLPMDWIQSIPASVPLIEDEEPCPHLAGDRLQIYVVPVGSQLAETLFGGF